uniref:Apolipoprotein A-IV a n=1 Tax=Sinocyclocheilus anshuiensis TaxID=1608454 RepID=A0A671Q8D7_9TELE
TKRKGDAAICIRQLSPYTLSSKVEQLRTAMAPYADSLDSETLKATLLQKSEELRGNMEQSVKELQAQLEPYTDLQQSLTPYAEDLKEKLDPYAQDLKAQLTSLYESFKLTNHAEMIKVISTDFF